MFLRSTKRKKDGKVHRYFSVVENRRLGTGGTAQRTVLYLGEINDKQEEAWRKSLTVFDQDRAEYTTMSLFPDDHAIPSGVSNGIQVRLVEMELRRPRVFGNCWLACELWRELGLDQFWQEGFAKGRESIRWEKVLQLLVVNRLIAPGSEFHLHRHWFLSSAMDELLNTDFAIADKDRLYRCLDRILEHKQDLFAFLKKKWADLFEADFEVLLYDLTSTYFEGEMKQNPKAKRGYSRDGRPDCLQVVIGLVVTTDGFPLAYEVMDGNTSDRTTLRKFLKHIEDRYGRAKRIWVMDRGIPTEEVLAEMRSSDPPTLYLVGTPKSKISEHEKHWLDLPWQKVRAMRRSLPSRDQLLLRIGAAKKEAGRAFGFVTIQLPGKDQTVTGDTFRFRLNKDKLKQAEHRDGYHLLRSNLSAEDPTFIWTLYVQLTQIEAVFRSLKSELDIRPIYHQKEDRIDAHIFLAFLAYCLQVTLKNRAMAYAPGLTPQAILEKLGDIQMIDVWFPTCDGRWLILPRYTQPENDLQLLLHHLHLELPSQPPPRVTAALPAIMSGASP